MRRLGVLAAGLLVAAAAPALHRAWPEGLGDPPVPADNALTAAKIELGRRLFYDADLSADGTMSCATCHEQRHAFADGNPTHPGVTGEPGRRNVPGLANVAWLSPLTFADPAATSLEVQAANPVFGTHPVEMGMTGRAAAIPARLGQDVCYRAMFARAFPESGGKIEFANVARAIAGFERTLVSFGSPFDRGVLGQPAREGRQLFARDCAACHAGPLFTDRRYHRITDLDLSAPDQGLYEKTDAETDRGAFRTPSLRNVALTGPWWHDGSAPTLQAAIERHGQIHSRDELVKLEAFLGSLSDPDFVTNRAFAMPARACGHRL